MANASTYIWNVYCVDEGGYQTVRNQKYRPTTCPNNAGHTIDPTQTKYEVHFATSFLEDPSKRTGFATVRGITFSCPANTTTTYNQTYPHDVVLMGGYIMPEDENKGDVLSLIFAPDLTVGTLTQLASTGATGVYISNSAVLNTTKACNITLGTDEYTIVSEDVMTSGIRTTPALLTEYPVGTLIKRNAYAFNNITLPSHGIMSFGKSNPFPSYIPAGTVLRFLYTNNSPSTAKTFNCYIEHY